MKTNIRVGTLPTFILAGYAPYTVYVGSDDSVSVILTSSDTLNNTINLPGGGFGYEGYPHAPLAMYINNCSVA